MNRCILPALPLGLLAFLAHGTALADGNRPPPPAAALLCRPAIEAAERAHGIPAHLLAAIARVESGRRDEASGTVAPWPWTINFDGAGSFYETKAQAAAAAEAMRPRAVRSVDVGCMQISLTMHPGAFANMQQAFDPMANADFGARFLSELFAKTGTWQKAVGMYHSATPALAAEYEARVYAALPGEQKLAGVMPAPPLGGLFQGSPFAPGWNRHPFPVAPGQVPPHVILQQASLGGAAAPGKTLDAYRTAPVRMAYTGLRGASP